MKKRMLIMLISIGILFGLIFGFKIIKALMMDYFLATYKAPVVYVSSTIANYASWKQELKASGSLRALQGVNVTTELAGMVQTIYFTPGALVQKGTLLVQLNADPEIALWQSLQATVELTRSVYTRDKVQYAVKAISKATLDSDVAALKSAIAQTAQQAAIIAQKTVRAPFSGRLGISAVNLGQYLNPGDKIVTLQTVNPIYVDFFVPQQAIPQLGMDQTVTVITDTFPEEKFTGQITTLNSAIDTSTRNVEIEATINNPNNKLVPGMFVSVIVNTGKAEQFITLPQTAITFNPYGDTVFIVKETGKDKKNNPILTANQAFVITGETRGDQITILKGINKGDQVVTSGQLKLKNNSHVAINNTVLPANNPDPKPIDE